jgi:hypothetical protein
MHSGFQISFKPASFAIGCALLGGVFFALGVWGLGFTPVTALLLAAGCVVAHWMLDLLHNIGHWLAARRTGHLMLGALFGEKLIFGRSLYPDDEPALPARVHIMRALGGPIVSTVIGVALVAFTASIWDRAGDWRWIAAWAAFESFAIFGPGAFLPLDFTDGGTLLKWWPVLRKGG